MKPVFSLEASVSFGPEGYSVPAFSSRADRVRITAAGTAEGPVSVTVLSYGRDASPHTVFSGEILPDETGAFSFAYGFDPVHLAVYRAADTFTLTFRAESAVLTALAVGEETEAAASSRTAVLHAHSLHEVDGIPSVPVYRADGTPIFVPAVPQNVLLIGNSILLGLFLQYGMCASSPMHDYVGLVTERLKKQNPALTVKKLHGGSFEGLTDAAAFERWYTEEANPYTKKPACESFTEDLDLIVVQLGDNVNTDDRKAAFPETADRLLARIKADAPRARVVWVYGWYNKCMTEEALLALTEKWKIECIDVSPLRDKEAEAAKGQLLENPAGGTVVAQDGWITHPGNEGMRRIADAILALLGTE